MLVALALLRLLPESPRYLARQPHRRAELARTLARMGHPTPEGVTFVDAVEHTERASLQTLFRHDRRR